MKILVINAGSSSCKYQLLEMDTRSVLCSGLAERIGQEGGRLTHKIAPDTDKEEKLVRESFFPTHAALTALGRMEQAGHFFAHGAAQIQRYFTGRAVRTFPHADGCGAKLGRPAPQLGLERQRVGLASHHGRKLRPNVPADDIQPVNLAPVRRQGLAAKKGRIKMQAAHPEALPLQQLGRQQTVEPARKQHYNLWRIAHAGLVRQHGPVRKGVTGGGRAILLLDL